MISGSIAYGQKVDYNSIILPASAANLDFSEKLVRLAWQNSPEVQVLMNELDKSALEVNQSKWNWLDNVRITGNLNEFNIDKDNQFQSQFYPRYNISASVSLGTFFVNPIKTKIEKENVDISRHDINTKKLALRAEVLTRYQTYVSSKEIFDLRKQMQDESFSDYKVKEQSFARGEIALNEYTIALDRYNQQQIFKIQAAKELEIARIAVEELIGVKLTDVQ